MSLLQGTSPPLTGSPLSIFYKDPSSFPMLQPRAEFKHEVHIISLCNNKKKSLFLLNCFGCAESQPTFKAFSACYLASFSYQTNVPKQIRLFQIHTGRNENILPGIFRWLKWLCVFRSICWRMTSAVKRRKISYLCVTTQISWTWIIRIEQKKGVLEGEKR